MGFVWGRGGRPPQKQCTVPGFFLEIFRRGVDDQHALELTNNTSVWYHFGKPFDVGRLQLIMDIILHVYIRSIEAGKDSHEGGGEDSPPPLAPI